MKTALRLWLGLAAALAASPLAAMDIRYDLPAAARVSLAVYAPDGRLVRTLLNGAPQAQGAQAVAWDGLDEQGAPLPAGTYAWKLLGTQGLRAEYLLTLGTNPEPAWDTWPGNHGGASAVAVDDSGLYVAGGCGEGTPLVLKQAHGGQRLWTVEHWLEAWMGGYSLAASDGKLYLLQQNGVIQRFAGDTGEHEVRWDVLLDEADRKDTHAIMDLDARDGRIVVSYANHDRVRWLSTTDGTVLAEARVPMPLGVACDPDGRTLVISQDAVLALKPGDAAPTGAPLITGLTAPWRLAVDAATGDILVAERGASQQVKRFSRDGTLLQAYGTPGGRLRQGRYDPLGFADIDDVAADGDGGFLIVEAWTAPRRVARFARAGALVREWYGGQQYANQGVADPADPRNVWIESHWSSLIHCQVDYVARTWRVHATYNYGGPDHAGGMITPHHHGHSPWVVLHRGGETYLGRESGFPCLLRVDEPGRRLVPVTSAFIKDRPKLASVDAVWAALDPAEARRRNLARWVDRNGDGAVSPDELSAEHAPRLWGDGHSCYDQRDFTFYSPRVNTWSDHTGVSVIRVREWLPGGVPVYGFGPDIGHCENYPAPFGDLQTKGAALAADGSLYVAVHTQVHKPIGVTGFGAAGGNRLLKYRPDGKLAWDVGRVAPGSTAAPGEMKSCYSVASVHNAAVVFDYADSLAHVWDENGLWVGRLLENPDTGAVPRAAYRLCSENFGNSVCAVPAGADIPGLASGDVLLVGGGQNNTPVYRITGWQGWTRLDGTVDLTPAAAATLVARVETERRRSGVIRARYLRKGSVKLDGRLDEWQDITPVEIMDGNEVRARVYLGWDNTALYAAFDVTTTRPWAHAATAPELLFQGGAAVALTYGPLEPAREAAGPGDVRVVAAPRDERAVAVEFLPVLPSGMAQAPGRPATYRTGQGEVTFASVASLPDGAAAALVKPPPAPALGDAPPPASGYIVEMRFPAHGLKLWPGLRFRFDAAVILADEDGRTAAVRLPWRSRAAGDLTVNDAYHEALLRPGNWGEAVLEW